jgi:hypothetical protein
MKQMTKQIELQPMRLLVGACSLVLALGAAHTALAQQVAKTPAQAQPVAVASSLNSFAPTSFSSLLPGAAAPAKPAVEEEEESPKAHKPGTDGVKVHGHWVMQAKNADGSLGERREFENSLINTRSSLNNLFDSTAGSQYMVGMLSGNLTVGDPGIGFVQVNQGSLTADPSTWCLLSGRAPSGIGCYVFTSTSSVWNIGATSETSGYIGSSVGLTYSANFDSASIVLSGNYTVPAGLTSISAVQSLYSFCMLKSATYANVQGALQGSATFRNADLGSLSCTTANANAGLGTSDTFNFGALTSTDVTSGTPAVPMPLSVTQGQIIQVTVTLTFS